MMISAQTDKMQRSEFDHTITQIREKLIGVAKRFTKASGLGVDAEDIVQEALAELWRLCESGYQIRNAEALAVKITKTVCVRYYRKRRVETISIEGLEYKDSGKASERVDIEDILRLRKRHFEQLSETQRLYLEMRNELGLSLDEISAKTGHPKASVKATISQARKTMSELLKKI